MTENREPVVLIVIENGAVWPRWVDRSRADADAFTRSARVLVQGESEAPARFAQRVAAYLDVLDKDSISIAAIACNERFDESAESARREIGNQVATAMARAGDRSGRICFCEPKRSSGRSRHALSSLVSELEQQSTKIGIEISVRFSTDSEHAARVA